MQPPRTSYLASGVSRTMAGFVGLGCDLAGDVATSFLDGFRASVWGESSGAALAQPTNAFCMHVQELSNEAQAL